MATKRSSQKQKTPQLPKVLIKTMTEATGASPLTIEYAFHESPFGPMLIASTKVGLCYLGFPEKKEGLSILRKRFPRATLIEKTNAFQRAVTKLFEKSGKKAPSVKAHLKGTPFQLAIWKGLLKIPHGKLTTYGLLAKHVKKPRALRAVGTAVGQNPLALLIPCHRVIPADGSLGGYHWGPDCKAAILEWEGVSLSD